MNLRKTLLCKLLSSETNVNDSGPIQKVISKVNLYCPKEHFLFCISFGTLTPPFTYKNSFSWNRKSLLTNALLN